MKADLTILLLSASTALLAQAAHSQERDPDRGYKPFEPQSCQDLVGGYKNSLGEDYICDDARAAYIVKAAPQAPDVEYQGNGIFCGPIGPEYNGEQLNTHFMVSSKADFSSGFGYVVAQDDVTGFILQQDRDFHAIGGAHIRRNAVKRCGVLPPMS